MRIPIIALLLASSGLAEDGMVLIPAGEFTMGRTKDTPDDQTKMRPIVLLDDRPAHRVWVDAFWLDRTEVTQKQYAEFVAATKRTPPYHWLQQISPPQGSADWPIHNVDWDDAKSYCEWRGKRLPSEAEWERAARGGKEGMTYPWGDKLDRKLAHFDVQTGPADVGKLPANEFGLHDMAGGVSEWCADWFEREYYKSSPAKNPKGPETGAYKVIRGGAWSDSGARITVFFRNWVRPNQKTPNVGFRCAKSQ